MNGKVINKDPYFDCRETIWMGKNKSIAQIQVIGSRTRGETSPPAVSMT
jgi:hypothetical protein